MAIKKYYLFVFALFVSCNFPTYVSLNQGQSTGLDFRYGKWLINDIDCNLRVSNKLTLLSKQDFDKYLKGRLFFIYEPKGIILPKKIEINPSKKTLEDLKKGTGFDYFINIRAGKVREELGTIDTTPHHFYSDRKNQSEVIVEVYDLNLLEIIYSQKVMGTISSQRDNKDVHFSKSSESLIIGCYKKVFKDIEQKSIKNEK